MYRTIFLFFYDLLDLADDLPAVFLNKIDVIDLAFCVLEVSMLRTAYKQPLKVVFPTEIQLAVNENALDI